MSALFLRQPPAAGGCLKNRADYWRSSSRCFSIDYKGIITEICVGDPGYSDMDRMDGAIHAAIGCKQNGGDACGRPWA